MDAGRLIAVRFAGRFCLESTPSPSGACCISSARSAEHFLVHAGVKSAPVNAPSQNFQSPRHPGFERADQRAHGDPGRREYALAWTESPALPSFPLVYEHITRAELSVAKVIATCWKPMKRGGTWNYAPSFRPTIADSRVDSQAMMDTTESQTSHDMQKVL